MASSLTAYWIIPPGLHSLLGLGVTAWSLEDALRIVTALGFGRYLPENLEDLTVREGITVAELDQRHVVPNMGPIVLRGMWYPFLAVGVPEWAAL